MKKIALCFIISYDHILNKEDLWREWIEENKDIINIYFHYTDYTKIKSDWIKKHALPKNFVVPTTYFHVVPAYMSILYYAMKRDVSNQWFCFLTDSCVPIITPQQFRNKFFKNQYKTIMRWKPAWWNVQICRRANLAKLSKDYHLGNDPWFILCKEDAVLCNKFALTEPKLFNLICQGGLANESIFIIMLKKYYRIYNNIINEITHATDWDRMMTTTSPYLFRDATSENIAWIEESLEKFPEVMFLRKVDSCFPSEILEKYCKPKNISYMDDIEFSFIPVFPYFYVSEIICLLLLAKLFFHVLPLFF